MKIAIKGHKSRGKEVIQILESLGGQNIHAYWGHSGDSIYYYINKHCKIVYDSIHVLSLYNYKLYTLEEFEKEFPFKVGDKVKYISSTGIIKGYCYMSNEPACEVESVELGIIATIPVKILKPYKEMKEERNITLTLDKAKEWYNKGGELKEIALQAFTKKELNSLPRSWNEFCEKYPIQDHEAFINYANGSITVCKECAGSGLGVWKRKPEKDRCKCVSQKSAEAHLAMMQLEQLRNCWWNGWKPIWDCSEKWCIRLWENELGIGVAAHAARFLTFPTKEMAEEFLECFRDLIETAGDLI